jgi:hypothetical protein
MSKRAAQILLATVLSMLLAGAAIAGYKCSTYCGTFAGYRWCNTQCR